MRHNQIKFLLNLRDVSSIITKMDYYFEGKIESQFSRLKDGLILGNKVITLYDKKLRVWDLLTLKKIKSFKLKNIIIIKIEALDANRIISSDDDGSLRIWDFKTLDILPPVIIQPQFSKYNSSFSVLLDNKIATTFLDDIRDTNIEIWDLNTGEKLMTLEGHSNEIICDLQIDKYRLVCAYDNSTIKVWNISSGICENTLQDNHAMNMFLLYENVIIIKSLLDYTSSIWNISTNLCEQILPDEEIADIMILFQNKVIMSCIDYSIIVYDIYTKEMIKLKNHKHNITHLHILPNNNLLSISRDEMRVWDLEIGKCIKEISYNINYSKVITNWNNKLIISDDQNLTIWN